MRILHLTSHLNVGGVTRYVLSLSRALAQHGHRVIIAADGGALEAEAATHGLAYWRVPLATSAEFSPRVFRAAHTLAARLRDEPADLIHAHTRVSQVVADRLSHRFGIPYVTTWHGFFRAGNLGRRLWPCTGALTIAISEPVRRHLLEDFHLPDARIRLIPHGIDAASCEVPVETSARQQFREEMRLGSNGPVIGTVARLVASKGVDQLIRSLPRIRAAVPGASLLIVGDGKERPALERLAAGEGVAEAVRFAGAVADTRVALSVMSVFVFLPAEEEGFGLALLEAMAGGRPIVAVRRGGGAAWVLEESGVGRLVEPGDPQALADAVIWYLQHGEDACRAAGKGRAVVKERYSLTRMVDQVEAVYRELR